LKGEAIVNSRNFMKKDQPIDLFNEEKNKSAGQILFMSAVDTSILDYKTGYKQVANDEDTRLFNWGFFFTDYLRQGLNISISVCIDCTLSNGAKADPSSLHYISSNSMNPYQKAMNAICSILLDYNTQKCVQLFGYGGIPAGHSEVSHFFPLTGDIENTSAESVEKIDEIYREKSKMWSLAEGQDSVIVSRRSRKGQLLNSKIIHLITR
jgi:hypothetical protein